MEKLEDIRKYYTEVIKTNRDFKTTACCDTDGLPQYLKEISKGIHPEVKEKFYGCGSPIPPELHGAAVLDLGCGTGRDCFIAASQTGPEGRVTGLDMTAEQLEVAKRHLPYHAEKFGFKSENVRFVQGYIEDLGSAEIESGSIDVVISNCVLNLSPDKPRLFGEIWRVLKPGGELYFSDVFAGRRIPKHLSDDPVMKGECLGGALYIEDFRRLLQSIGCKDYRALTKTPIELTDAEIVKKAGMIDFYSITVRVFKLDLEDRCEDYGQVAYYLGTIGDTPHGFTLDDHHYFPAGRPVPVCGNTAAMLQKTRYKKHFKVTGDTSVHYGLFGCAPSQIDASGNGCC